MIAISFVMKSFFRLSGLRPDRGLWVIFVRNAVSAVNFCNKYFTAFLKKIHREIHRFSYKNSSHRHLCQINVKNAVNELNFCKKCGDCSESGERIFPRISYKNSPQKSPNFLQ